MADVKILIISILCLRLCGACTGGNGPVPPGDLSPVTVENAVLDSLGELAYADFSAFEQDPEGFLAPLENAELREEQRETHLWILINMAYAFQQNSQMVQSTAYYEKALMYDNDYGILERGDRLTYLYKPLSNNYTVLSDYGKAERLQLIAFEDADTPVDKASFCNNLALLYTYKGEMEKAREYGLRGLSYARDSIHLTVLLHNSLSNTYASTGQTDSARWHNARALRLGRFSGLGGTEADGRTAAASIASLSQLAGFLGLDGAHQKARKALSEALDLESRFFPESRFREKAALYNKLGELELLQNHIARARASFMRGLSLYDRENLRQYTSTYTKINLLRNLGATHAATQSDSAWFYYRKAVEADFAYQQRVTTKASHLRNNLWNRRLLEEVFAFAHRADPDPEQFETLLWMTELTKARLLWNDINRSEYWASGQTGMEEARHGLRKLYAERDQLHDRPEDSLERQEIDREISGLLTTFELEEQYFTRNVRLPDFDRFRDDLRAQEVLMYAYYIHSDHSLSVFRNERGKLSYWHREASGLMDTLTTFKERYFSTSPHAFNARPAAYFEFAGYLREILLPDLGSERADLRLSLDNELFTVPFDALRDGDRFLVEKFNLQYVHSLFIDNLHPVRDFRAEPIHILFREQYDPPLGDLQFVKAEVSGLKRKFKTRVFAPGNLPSESLMDAFDHRGIIHIAAHAIIDERLDTKLLLDLPVSTDQLRYYTMQAPLVVLSACNTASGQLLLSEGLESINRAFLSKGVKGVVATHWFANDDAMLDLAGKFYSNLAQSKRPVHALAEAKRQYLAEQSEAGRNPWYWANMAYTGADIKIDLPQRAGLDRLGISVLLFAIALINKP